MKRTAWIVVLLAMAASAARAQPCIDYGEYLHWAGRLATIPNAWDVAVQDGTAYVASDVRGLVVADVSDPKKPVELTSLYIQYADRVAVGGSHAYVGANRRILVVDVSNSAAPDSIASLAVSGPVQDLTVLGTRLLATIEPNQLLVIDVANPSSPQLLDSVLVSDLTTADQIRGLTVSNGRALVAVGFAGLTVVDAVTADPVVVGHLNTSDWAVDVAAAGDFAYVVGNDFENADAAVHIVDLQSPVTPQAVGQIDIPVWCSKVAISDQTLFVFAANSGRTWIYDIADPIHPVFVALIHMAGYNSGVHIDPGWVYVTGGPGLEVIDFRTPEPATALASLASGVDGIALRNEVAYLAIYGGVQVVDISNPLTPTVTGTVNTAGNPRDIVLSNEHAYVADNYGGLAILDISSPGSPVLVGQIYTDSQVEGVAVAGQYVYTAGAGPGRVIDVSNPAAPRIVAGIDGALNGIAVRDDFAYAAGAGFTISDISDPTSPVVASHTNLDILLDVALTGNYAYVSDRSRNLIVLDIADPRAPTEVSRVALPASGEAIHVSGTSAYVSCGVAGLLVLDVSNPAAPTVVGGIDTGGVALNVALTENLAFVADHFSLAIVPRQCDGPTPVSITDLQAVETDGEVRITWRVHEGGFLGFWIERAQGGDPRESDYEILNAASRLDPGPTGEFRDRTYEAGVVHAYRLLAEMEDGSRQRFGPVILETSVLALGLMALPNPAHGTANLQFAIPRAADVRLEVYDVAGRRVRTLLNGPTRAGRHAVTWDGQDEARSSVASGVYLLRLEMARATQVRRLTLVR